MSFSMLTHVSRQGLSAVEPGFGRRSWEVVFLTLPTCNRKDSLGGRVEFPFCNVFFSIYPPESCSRDPGRSYLMNGYRRFVGSPYKAIPRVPVLSRKLQGSYCLCKVLCCIRLHPSPGGPSILVGLAPERLFSICL